MATNQETGIDWRQAFFFGLMLFFLIGGLFGIVLSILFGAVAFLGIVTATGWLAVEAVLVFIGSVVMLSYSYSWFVGGIE